MELIYLSQAKRVGLTGGHQFDILEPHNFAFVVYWQDFLVSIHHYVKSLGEQFLTV